MCFVLEFKMYSKYYVLMKRLRIIPLMPMKHIL